MPRTEMFRFLRRVATDHAAAARLGMPVLEFREARLARAAGTLSRRDALRIFGASAAVLGAASVLRAPRAAAVPLGGTEARIAVIGAGIAGLNTALALADAGVRCTVYEASDRVGGRMFSERDYWGGGQVTEYGGELIDTDHSVIRALCKRFSIGLTDIRAAEPVGSNDVLYYEGRYRSHAEFVAEFQPVYKALRADIDRAGADAPTWDSSTPFGVALSRMSVQEWISTRVPGGYSTWIARFLDDAYVVEYGRDTSEQTAVNLAYMMIDQSDLSEPEIWGASDERFHITAGNQTLPEAIARALPAGTVQHGHRLEALVRNSDGSQTLHFDTGAVRADHTVLTVPLGVLQRLDLSRAGFDPRMRGAVSQLQMGFCTKLHMRFSSRPWLGHGPWPGVANGISFSDTGYQQVWDATTGQPGPSGIAVQYGGGSGALSFQPSSPFSNAFSPYVRSSVRQKLSQLAPVVPPLADAYTGQATLAAWHRNPLSHGAYSCYPVDYCHRFAGYEATRQGLIHLAGEHTSVDSQGYMNGGAESGARAAAELLSLL
ncbi:NAD(P)/FAD-dependent oxidoreductase [Kutzneria sp. 744]|uniref:flavin monoamine oxidase family protein n=1 Tax=Kutzneria sp. (strain 744) TaxID=345341 RepID=UPI0004AE6DDD|nr:NAD(P)/FAD-dependent oxidoreductase [Kutzneria sp. 744]